MPITVNVVQVTPPSRLICARSSAASAAPSVPRTVSVVSRVTKSLLLNPVSSLMPAMAMVLLASGAVVSTVTIWLAVAPIFPAVSITRT